MRPSLVGLLALAAAAATACNLAESSEDVGAPAGSSSGGGGATVTTGNGATGTMSGAMSATGSAQGGQSGVGGGGGGSPPPNESPGMIDCGGRTCDVDTSHCCPAGDTSVCVDKGEPCPNDIGAAGGFTSMTCDDAADCNGGICCVDVDDMNPLSFVYECAPGPCDAHEACIPGGVCSSGFECVLDPSEPSGAHCVPSMGVGVVCGADTCVPDDGACCASTSTCAPYGDKCTGLMECDDAADCGPGYVCCGDSGTFTAVCSAPAACAGLVLCASDADCTNGTCGAPATSGFPANVKACK